MDLSSVSGFSSIYQLVDQYMAIEQRPRDQVISQRNQLNSKKSVFSKLDSLLSSLKSKMSYLTDEVSNPFLVKNGTSSDTDKIAVTAQGTASVGNHSITVSQLAKSDTRVSDQFNDADSSFTSFTTDQTFTIEVGHPTDSDANNRVSISVTVSAADLSGTNDDVLSAISDAIDDAMSQAVTDETIDSDEVIHSSVVNEETGKSRLILRSEQTGYTYRMEFGSSALLDTLNINANTQSSGTSGGYITPVGTSATDSGLNSNFTLDGLTFYRDSNNVSDALEGITLKLLDTFSTDQTISVSSDTDTVKNDVQDFIDKYNEAVKYIHDNTLVDPTTHRAGVLATDGVYRDIASDLRTIVGSKVDSTSSDNYTLLYNIGIEASDDGTLSITDSSKFTAALEANPSYVADLFRSSDGIATQIKDYVDDFVNPDGTIDNSQEQINSQITHLNDRISYMNEVLDKKRQQYINEFAELQKTMSVLQSQQAFFSAFLGGG